MEKTIKELEELSLQRKTNCKLDYLLKNADPNDSISVNVTLHADQWRQVLFLMTYYSEKGSRGYNSISSTLWHIIDRAHKGLLNSLAKKAKEGQQAPQKKPADQPNPENPDEGDEGGEGDPFGFGF